MTLQTVKPISLANVRAEYGAPLGTALGAFVRGGAWVPDTSQNIAVPTAKPIALRDLLGAGSTPDVSILPHTFNVINFGGSASLVLHVDRDGDYYGTGTQTFALPGEWWQGTPGNPGDGYWMRLTGSGDPPVGITLGAWLPLSTNRAWSWFVLNASEAWSGLLELADDAGGANIVDSATIDMTLESTP